MIGVGKVKHCFLFLIQFSNSFISGGTGPAEMSYMPAIDTRIRGHVGRTRSGDLGLRTFKVGPLEHAVPGISFKASENAG